MSYIITYIINYWWAANYGANLTAYALHKLISQSVLINNLDYEQRHKDTTLKFNHEFSKNHLITSPIPINLSSFIKLCNTVNTFITGSDQLFRLKKKKKKRYQYLLDFADANSKKIAF